MVRNKNGQVGCIMWDWLGENELGLYLELIECIVVRESALVDC